jgi:hypothetical protein
MSAAIRNADDVIMLYRRRDGLSNELPGVFRNGGESLSQAYRYSIRRCFAHFGTHLGQFWPVFVEHFGAKEPKLHI